jgi:hypothetical protein
MRLTLKLHPEESAADGPRPGSAIAGADREPNPFNVYATIRPLGKLQRLKKSYFFISCCEVRCSKLPISVVEQTTVRAFTRDECAPNAVVHIRREVERLSRSKSLWRARGDFFISLFIYCLFRECRGLT